MTVEIAVHIHIIMPIHKGFPLVPILFLHKHTGETTIQHHRPVLLGHMLARAGLKKHVLLCCTEGGRPLKTKGGAWALVGQDCTSQASSRKATN